MRTALFILAVVLCTVNVSAQDVPTHNPDGRYPSLHLLYGWPQRSADLNGKGYKFNNNPFFSATVKLPVSDVITGTFFIEYTGYEQTLNSPAYWEGRVHIPATVTSTEYAQTIMGLGLSFYFGN